VSLSRSGEVWINIIYPALKKDLGKHGQNERQEKNDLLTGGAAPGHHDPTCARRKLVNLKSDDRTGFIKLVRLTQTRGSPSSPAH
jgi:hypothetical protein